MHPNTLSLVKELAKSVNAENAIAMKAYMKNQFEFLGIPTPERRKIFKAHVKQNAIKDEHELEVIVRELWMLREREFHYCGMEILLYYEKLWQQEIIDLIEYLLTTKSWWDTVDFLAYDCGGNYFNVPRQNKNHYSQMESFGKFLVAKKQSPVSKKLQEGYRYYPSV